MAGTKNSAGPGNPSSDLAVAARDARSVPAPLPAAERKARAAAAEHAQNPDALAADIERTREDLAMTLGAIAEKVSPKKVVARTRLQATEKVKGTTGNALAAVRASALAAKARVTSDSAAAKAKVIAALPAGVGGQLPPTDAVSVPDLPSPSYQAPLTSPLYSASVSVIRPEYVAAGVAAAVVAWLVVRRRH